MKKLYFLVLTILSIGFFKAQGDAGIFESYAVLNINGAGNVYYDLQATTGNPDFQGADLGTFNSGTESLVFAGGEVKTWKNGDADVTGSKMFYRISSGTPSGVFQNLALGFQQDLGFGDQKWGTVSGSQNIIQGLPIGTYMIEVYSVAYTNKGEKYSSNSGANYRAYFTISSSLSVGDISNAKTKSFVSEGKLYTSQKGNLDIQVYDFSGKLVKKLNTNSSSNGLELNLPKKGNYLVKVNNEVVKIAY